MVNLLNREKLFFGLVFIVVAYYAIVYPIIDVKFATWDDQGMSYMTFKDWIESAYKQSRISAFFNAFLARVAYFIDSHVYFKSVQVLTNIILVVLLSILVTSYSSNKYLGFLYTILTLILWQNSFSHNFLVSYPFYIAFSIICLICSVLFFKYFLETNGKKHLFISIFFWIIALKGTEFYLMYLPVFLFVAYHKSIHNNITRKFTDSIVLAKWHIIVTFLTLFIYVLFRMSSEGVYGGTVLRLDFLNIIYSWAVYTFGLFPGVQFYENLSRLDIFGLIEFNMIVITLLVFYLLLKLKAEIQKVEINFKNYLLFIVFVYILLAPNFLISLTTKYQDWVKYNGVIDYLYSVYSYFPIVFLFIIILVKVKNKYLYLFFSFLIAILALSIQINNKYIGSSQAKYSEKFFLLDTLLKSKYISEKENGFKIWAPSLWDEKMVTANYWIVDGWTRYAEMKTGKSIFIERFAENYDAEIKYIRSNENKNSFLIYSEKGKIKAVVTYKDKSQILYNSSLKSMSIMNGGYLSNNSILKSLDLNKPSFKNIYGVNLFDIKEDVDINTFISFTNYDVDQIFNNIISFEKGFYSLESNGVDKWIWGYDKSQINIQMNSKKEVNLYLKMRVASARNVKLKINGQEKAFEFNQLNPKTISIPISLNMGNNILEISSDKDSIKLSEADNRKFAYCIFDISLDIIH